VFICFDEQLECFFMTLVFKILNGSAFIIFAYCRHLQQKRSHKYLTRTLTCLNIFDREGDSGLKYFNGLFNDL